MIHQNEAKNVFYKGVSLVGTFLFVALLSIFPYTLCKGAEYNFRPVTADYRYQFPKDHYAHPEFQTEWWYYTGHLETPEGGRYGYELTFFRTGIATQRERSSKSAWVMRDIYFAHLAISDEAAESFHFREKINRNGPGIAGAEEDRLLVWNEDWRVEEKKGKQHLLAKEEKFGIDLSLTLLKPPIIHGEEGVSRKSQTPGDASHYYSLTRIATEGFLCIEDKKLAVRGVSWMDHEFFSHTTPEGLEGWDWFSLQLDNNTEIMLYQLRQKGGNISPVSSGTFIGLKGETTHLTLSEFTITPVDKWKSQKNGALYPSGWRIEIPDYSLSLVVKPTFKDQELITRETTYWEGDCTISGTYKGNPISGLGYTELTGYAESLSK